MTIQYKRACKLIVGVTKGQQKALDFSDFRIVFNVRQATKDTPQSAEIYIYNLSTATMSQFTGEGQEVFLYAGYEGNMDLIFHGQVYQTRRGRENQTDTYFCILAQSADSAYNYAVLTGSLAKNWSLSDLRKKVMTQFEPHGITAGYQENLPDTKFPRGKVMYKMARDYLNQISDTANLDWIFDNNQVVMVKRAGNTNQPIVVINTDTGMLGMPQLTNDGLSVSCLLNPRIKWGGQVQLDNQTIETQNSPASTEDNIPKAFLAANGLYNVISVSHQGDTRGDTWQTDVVGWGAAMQSPSSTGILPSGASNGV